MCRCVYKHMTRPGTTCPRRKWLSIQPDEPQVVHLSKILSLPKVIIQALLNRHCVTEEQIDYYLNPRLSHLSDPFQLTGMDEAITRITKAIETQERIVIYGDYDVDGVTSCALMVSVLSQLGAMVEPFLPHRVDDGYGLAVDTLEKCISTQSPNLIITVDCGTNAIDAVRLAHEKGVDVIITDHHELSDAPVVEAIVVNPKKGALDAVRMLAGVGVAFKVCHALIKRARDIQMPGAETTDLKNHLDLVATGTIADIVPLHGENRILAFSGLRKLNTDPVQGITALIGVAAIKQPLTSYHIGYLIGPRINAAGRLGDAQAALELLLTSDSTRARNLAIQLDASNRERQDVESRMVKEAMTHIDTFFDPERHFGLVLAEQNWHMGVVGIAASRICSHYRRPTVVISLDENGTGRGSCRSIEGYDVLASLQSCSDLLVKYGGHKMAAGLEIETQYLEAFRERFNELACQALKGQDLRQEMIIDGWVTLAEMNDDLFEYQRKMEPFGHENPAPIWAVHGVRIGDDIRTVGKKHLKMRITDGVNDMEAIAFGFADVELPVGEVDIAFRLQENHFMGRRTLQLNVQDVREA